MSPLENTFICVRRVRRTHAHIHMHMHTNTHINILAPVHEYCLIIGNTCLILSHLHLRIKVIKRASTVPFCDCVLVNVALFACLLWWTWQQVVAECVVFECDVSLWYMVTLLCATLFFFVAPL